MFDKWRKLVSLHKIYSVPEKYLFICYLNRMRGIHSPHHDVYVLYRLVVSVSFDIFHEHQYVRNPSYSTQVDLDRLILNY